MLFDNFLSEVGILLPIYLNTPIFVYWSQEIRGHIYLSYELSSQQAKILSCYIAYALFSHISCSPLACTFRID